jgi:hypothetical protein
MRDASFRISLDIHDIQSQVSIPVKRGDTARRIYINLTENGMPYEIESGCLAVFSGVKSDGAKIFNDCIIEGNRIRYDMTEQTVSTEGLVNVEIILYGADDAILCSPRFDLVVDDRAVGVEILSEDERNILDAYALAEAERVKAYNNIGIDVVGSADYITVIKTNTDGTKEETVIPRGKNSVSPEHIVYEIDALSQDSTVPSSKAVVDYVDNLAGTFVTPEMYGAVGDGRTDDTEAFQRAIYALAKEGGGVLRLLNKSYAVTNIQLDTRVSIIGCGAGSEVRSIGNSDVITIPANANLNTIANLTINGNNNMDTDAYLIEPNGVIGIHIEETPSGEFGGSAHINRMKPNDNTNKNHCFGFIENVTITNCKAEGIYIGKNRVLMSLSSINSVKNGKGVTILGHECMLNNINVNSKTTGLVVGGSNNKVSNVKAYMCCTKSNPTGADNYAVAGVSVLGMRNQLTNIESQDNMGNGFTIRGNSNVLTNVIADSCGRSSYTTKEATDFHGFNIGGESNVISGVNTVRAGNDYNIIANKAVKLEGATNYKLDVKVEAGSAISMPEPINLYESTIYKDSFYDKGALSGTLNNVSALKVGVYRTGGATLTILSGNDSVVIPQYSTLYIVREGSVSGAFYFEAMTGNLNFFKSITEVKTFNPTN